MLGDVGTFARREPAMFLGGAFVLGLLGGRFLKSSHVRPPSTNAGPRNSSDMTASSERGYGRRGGQERPLGKSVSPNANPSSATPPFASEKPREMAGMRGAPYESAAKQPGTV